MASHWLVVAAVLAGPLGMGVSAAAAMKTCGVACPCDEEQESAHGTEAAHDDEGCNDASASEHHDEAPCDDDCPDDCPECSCCPGLTVGLAAIVVPDLPGAASALSCLPTSEAPASGETSGVFRPPRSLT